MRTIDIITIIVTAINFICGIYIAVNYFCSKKTQLSNSEKILEPDFFCKNSDEKLRKIDQKVQYLAEIWAIVGYYEKERNKSVSSVSFYCKSVEIKKMFDSVSLYSRNTDLFLYRLDRYLSKEILLVYMNYSNRHIDKRDLYIKERIEYYIKEIYTEVDNTKQNNIHTLIKKLNYDIDNDSYDKILKSYEKLLVNFNSLKEEDDHRKVEKEEKKLLLLLEQK